MLKIAAEGIAPRLAACCLINSSAQSSCQRVAPQAAKATQKCLSQSHMLHKKLVIKDHYDFDQKVSTISNHNYLYLNVNALAFAHSHTDASAVALCNALGMRLSDWLLAVWPT